MSAEQRRQGLQALTKADGGAGGTEERSQGRQRRQARREDALGTAGVERMAAFVSSRRTYPWYCGFSAKIRGDGSTIAVPMAVRIWRMDFRTASRKAPLAFSIKCQRSATWIACGSARCAAASTIAGDDTDLRLLRQPDFSGGRLSIGQESDRRMSFKVADQRVVTMIAPPGPVIDASNRGRRTPSGSTPAHHN
jgi:hypothetical protein